MWETYNALCETVQSAIAHVFWLFYTLVLVNIWKAITLVFITIKDLFVEAFLIFYYNPITDHPFLLLYFLIWLYHYVRYIKIDGLRIGTRYIIKDTFLFIFHVFCHIFNFGYGYVDDHNLTIAEKKEEQEYRHKIAKEYAEEEKARKLQETMDNILKENQKIHQELKIAKYNGY